MPQQVHGSIPFHAASREDVLSGASPIAGSFTGSTNRQRMSEMFNLGWDTETDGARRTYVFWRNDGRLFACGTHFMAMSHERYDYDGESEAMHDFVARIREEYRMRGSQCQ